MEEKWVNFWIDSLTFYDLVTSRNKWIGIVKKHFNCNVSRPKKFKRNINNLRIPDFGEGASYKGNETLGQWAENNGINLDW